MRTITYELAVEQAQFEGECDQPLLGTVVEVALDPAPLTIGGSHDPGPRSLEFGRLTAQLPYRGLQRGAEPGVVSSEFSPLGLEETPLQEVRSQIRDNPAEAREGQ